MIILETPKVVSLKTKYGIMNVFKGDDPIGTCLYHYGEWADQEFDIIDKLVNKDSCCIDIGSNIGTHTIWLSHKCSNNLIFSFEPQFYIFLLLNSNILINNCFNVIPTRSFIFNENKFIKTIIDNPNHIKFNYGEFNINCIDETNPMDTQVIKLDDVDFLGNKIDFIKMDCEGTEKQVLESGKELILHDKPNMYIEFNELKGNDPVLETLKDFGYNCYWHVYTKFNPNNHNQFKTNIWITDDMKSSNDNISLYFESNAICIHKDKDNGLFAEYEPIVLGDNLTKYVIRHGLLEE